MGPRGSLLARLAARRLAARGLEATESEQLLGRMTLPELREVKAILIAAHERAGAPLDALLRDEWLTTDERLQLKALDAAAAARSEEDVARLDAEQRRLEQEQRALGS